MFFTHEFTHVSHVLSSTHIPHVLHMFLHVFYMRFYTWFSHVLHMNCFAGMFCCTTLGQESLKSGILRDHL